MKKRAVVYARVSTDDQRDNYSIPSQIVACVQYAEAKGYSVVGDRFVDPITGLDLASPSKEAVRAYVDDYTSRELSRPALDDALRYLAAVGYDLLVVHAIDRLARDPYIRQTLEIAFRQQGAKVEYVLGNYDDTPEGEVRKDLDAVFAKWENAKRVERCDRGKKRKAEMGLFVAGREPYGYVIDKTAFGGLAVVEEHAAVVRKVFHMYAVEGMSIRRIVDALMRGKVPTPLGAEKWAQSSVRRMLLNTTYVGKVFYNKYKRNGSDLEMKDRDEWIEIETTPIVEQWLFDEVQKRIAENAKGLRRQPARFYLLSRMVKCALCEQAYFVQTQKAGKNGRTNDAQSYRHRVSHGHCCNHQVSARILEPIVWDEIAELLMEPERLREGYEDSLAQQTDSTHRLEEHLETLHRRAKSLEEMRRNLTAAYVDPDVKMTKTEYLEQKEQVDREVAELTSETDRVKKELAAVPVPADLETLEAFASTIRELIVNEEGITPQQKRQILEMLHVRVLIDSQAGELKIEGWFGPAIEGLSYTASGCCNPRANGGPDCCPRRRSL
jgi:site-specific DNA recombinase